jgi:hypothetical protein
MTTERLDRDKLRRQAIRAGEMDGAACVHPDEMLALLDQLDAADAVEKNCRDLLVHYGYHSGSIPQAIDTLCAAIVDNTESVLELLKRLGAAEKALREIDELLLFMRIPLERARTQAGPSAQPQNVDVFWHTGADTVVRILDWMAARAAPAEDEGGE